MMSDPVDVLELHARRARVLAYGLAACLVIGSSAYDSATGDPTGDRVETEVQATELTSEALALDVHIDPTPDEALAPPAEEPPAAVEPPDEGAELVVLGGSPIDVDHGDTGSSGAAADPPHPSPLTAPEETHDPLETHPTATTDIAADTKNDAATDTAAPTPSRVVPPNARNPAAAASLVVSQEGAMVTLRFASAEARVRVVEDAVVCRAPGARWLFELSEGLCVPLGTRGDKYLVDAWRERRCGSFEDAICGHPLRPEFAAIVATRIGTLRAEEHAYGVVQPDGGIRWELVR